jgi:hypothetical protein
MASARLTVVDLRRELGDFKGRYPQLGVDELFADWSAAGELPRVRGQNNDQQADTLTIGDAKGRE